QRHRLGDLVDDIGQRWNQARDEGRSIDPAAFRPEAEEDKRQHREKCDEVTIEVLRPGLVVADQIKLEERRRGPDDDRREDGEVAAGKTVSLFHRHSLAVMLSGFETEQRLLAIVK